jgi:tRNA pseudouridine55 synthase
MASGILLLDKPLGLSSNAALQRVRTLYERVKAGHVGSLDPLATGMLPVCLGEATKVAGDILAGRKCYRFSIALGTRTSTGDAEGEPVERRPVPPLTAAAVESILQRFRGVQTQVPPMYSALKRDGQPLYRLARAGLCVPRAPRTIELGELRLLLMSPERLDLETVCSKGTYIRVLAEDLAAALETCGHVAALRRVYVEPFQGQPMHSLEALAALKAQGTVLPLMPADAPLGHLPAVTLAVAEVARVLKGQSIRVTLPGALPRVRIYGAGGEFLGLGETDLAGMLQPRRLLLAGPPAGA